MRTTTLASAVLALAAGLVSLPAPAGADLPLGNAVVVAGPEPCDNATCWVLEVTCQQLTQPARVRLKVGEPKNTSTEGTILFASGGGGRSLWESFGREAVKALDKLEKGGFQTVQLAWIDAWLNGAPGQLEGQARLACRPATVAQWVWDNLHPADPEAALCATGNSGGAAQVSYMLSHYGLDDMLSAIVPTGGPPMGRIDLGCLLDQNPGGVPLIYGPQSRDTIDRGFGIYSGNGPCATRDDGFGRRFRRSSIATRGLDQYVFPDTLVWFVFGENDRTSAVGQGLTFYDRLVDAGSPLVDLSIAPETPHATPSTKQGARMIRDILLGGCHPW